MKVESNRRKREVKGKLTSSGDEKFAIFQTDDPRTKENMSMVLCVYVFLCVGVCT